MKNVRLSDDEVAYICRAIHYYLSFENNNIFNERKITEGMYYLKAHHEAINKLIDKLKSGEIINSKQADYLPEEYWDQL